MKLRLMITFNPVLKNFWRTNNWRKDLNFFHGIWHFIDFFNVYGTFQAY